jgi:hypothetical protein
VLHGSPRVTRDLDICYSRVAGQPARLSKALAPFKPTLRGAPESLPFTLDQATLEGGLNFTLQSSAGDLNLRAEVSGPGSFTVVQRLSVVMSIYERDVNVLSLEGLERAKRAAGRLKDLVDLEEILEIRRQTGR